MRLPDPREEPVLVPLLLVYVALSSYLGLAGQLFLAEGAVLRAVEMTVSAWVGSPLAAVFFLVGSTVAGLAGLGRARDGDYVEGGALAFVVSLATYWVSWLVLRYVENPGERASLGDVVVAVPFVASLGIVGLAFATLAPLAWARWGDPWLGSEAVAGGGSDRVEGGD